MGEEEGREGVRGRKEGRKEVREEMNIKSATQCNSENHLCQTLPLPTIIKIMQQKAYNRDKLSLKICCERNQLAMRGQEDSVQRY